MSAQREFARPGTRGVIPEVLMEIPETLICPGAVMVFVVVEVGGGAILTGILEIVGAWIDDAVTPANGDTLGVGIVANGLTPRLAISQEASGIPARGLPPGVVGVVDIGVDGDAGGPLDPALHIPETPTVPIA